MALMRNLRNILLCRDMPGAAINTVVATLTDRDRVLMSRLLPFRYLAAYREVQQVHSLWTQAVMDALEEAVMVTVDNIAGFDANTRVLVAADVSGSMYSRISRRSTVQNFDIGLLLAMMLKCRCRQVVCGMFGEIWKVINLPSSNVLANVNAMYEREGEVGYATNGHLVIDYLCEQHQVIDKVMMFTDCQMWSSNRNNSLRKSWHQYKAIAPEAQLYLFDLAGYGQAPLSLAERDVYLIAGWSDKVFDALAAIENGSTALAEIKKIEL